jgi:hypothetical protein
VKVKVSLEAQFEGARLNWKWDRKTDPKALYLQPHLQNSERAEKYCTLRLNTYHVASLLCVFERRLDKFEVRKNHFIFRLMRSSEGGISISGQVAQRGMEMTPARMGLAVFLDPAMCILLKAYLESVLTEMFGIDNYLRMVQLTRHFLSRKQRIPPVKNRKGDAQRSVPVNIFDAHDLPKISSVSSAAVVSPDQPVETLALPATVIPEEQAMLIASELFGSPDAEEETPPVDIPAEGDAVPDLDQGVQATPAAAHGNACVGGRRGRSNREKKKETPKTSKTSREAQLSSNRKSVGKKRPKKKGAEQETISI